MNNSYYNNHQEELLAIQNLRYDYCKIFEKRIHNNNKKSYYKTFKCDKCNKEINYIYYIDLGIIYRVGTLENGIINNIYSLCIL